ncbi:lytic transglycosylase domain-containing protein [Paracoccus zhejiangensis]|uniref:Lytic transglycosylase n=1 Tax=Paracoccus zhejiangensis TaxID=1077935 RepID=A0A2H5EUX9_9RHOB|nr:lytic transglycosylase domain-containing protein [Paracoccus zhejiangensis]AUH63091.1 lytic transglycosylase [Paracoccus zhejiangensis]
MRFIGHIFRAGALALMLPALPARAENAGAMALALAAAETGDWVTARKAAGRSGPMAEALVGWQALIAGNGAFRDFLAFRLNHPGWPGEAALIRRGDALLRPDLPPDQIRNWFGDRLPDSLRTETAFLATLSASEAKAERERFWTTVPLEPAEEAAFLKTYADELTPLAAARAFAMLDLGEWQAAERRLAELSAPDAALARARIALQARRDGVDDLINALPEPARADAGLAMDRYRWRVRAKMHDLARDLMLERSTSAEALRDPEVWAEMRVDYARLAMRQGDWATAEKLARAHFLPPENEHYPDLEWLAGYAAMRAGAADRALAHFDHLETVVGSAISRARADYWQGRAQEALGKGDAARAAYQAGAEYIGTYYGQLSAEKLHLPMPAEFAVPGKALDSLPDWRGSDLVGNELFNAGLWMLGTGRADQAQQFFLQAAATGAEPDDIARMARLMLEARKPWHALRLSKRAASLGAIYPAAHFPLTGLEDTDLGIPPELVLSIARQESEFNHTVGSHAGALGLMQVIPDTAQAMARKIGEPYERARLTQDAGYNARLGAAYLDGLRDRFGASVALVASGYNAGPGRPARWIGDFGDLRKGADHGGADAVDWVELIPFDETRNYVMRVAEAQPIYRARIMGKTVPIVPTWDLTGGGLMPAPPLRLTLALSAQPPARPLRLARLPVSDEMQAAVAAMPVPRLAADAGDGFRWPEGISAPSPLPSDARATR